MKLTVALSPALLDRGPIARQAVVCIDVLRATTTMAAALAAGVGEIRIFTDIPSAAAAAGAHAAETRLLCGERDCLPPEGFDLGNSPGHFSQAHSGKTLFMTTTNGTRAIHAALGARRVWVGALVNASATAHRLAEAGDDVVFLCAAREGRPSLDDLLGAGAMIEALARRADVEIADDGGHIARDLFLMHRGNLAAALRSAAAGQALVKLGLEEDIGFAARLDAIDIVGEVLGEAPRVVRA